jgi:hypothetical protein
MTLLTQTVLISKKTTSETSRTHFRKFARQKGPPKANIRRPPRVTDLGEWEEQFGFPPKITFAFIGWLEPKHNIPLRLRRSQHRAISSARKASQL